MGCCHHFPESGYDIFLLFSFRHNLCIVSRQKAYLFPVPGHNVPTPGHNTPLPGLFSTNPGQNSYEDPGLWRAPGLKLFFTWVWYLIWAIADQQNCLQHWVNIMQGNVISLGISFGRRLYSTCHHAHIIGKIKISVKTQSKPIKEWFFLSLFFAAIWRIPLEITSKG